MKYFTALPLAAALASADTASKDFYHYLVFLWILPRKSYGLQCAVFLSKRKALIGLGEGHLRPVQHTGSDDRGRLPRSGERYLYHVLPC